MLVAQTIHCPYCGEAFATTVDPTAGNQEYIEDCQVCCRPIVLRVDADGERVAVSARREDD